MLLTPLLRARLASTLPPIASDGAVLQKVPLSAILLKPGEVAEGEIIRTPLGTATFALIAPVTPYKTLADKLVRPSDANLSARITSMGQIHRVMPLTGAMCLGVACQIKGSVANNIIDNTAGDFLFANPSGVLPINATVVFENGEWVAKLVTVYRTARALMEGNILIPST